MLNTILSAEKFDLSEIRLLRHQEKGHIPYEIWRDNRQSFDLYQSTQSIKNEGKLRAKYWISFVVTPKNETLFVGVYEVKGFMEGVDSGGSCHIYDLILDQRLNDLIGKLLIDWGDGERAWIQHTDRQDKRILEIRKEFKEPDFPGFLNFISPLSKINGLPRNWITTLQSSRGVYLLTCPKTKEQYVGSATGESGFWGRWQAYIKSGDGGNIALKSRDYSDYQISILEVAGTASTYEDIIHMENLWKSKLQSREMGLNRN
ncbi:MAG: GIY-YIG nuclease family protein [Anaerolineales bacterium]|jgi:hypothetical protein|nr:GIY-YIG nuclease family protein [Anaerolineales bacterium]